MLTNDTIVKVVNRDNGTVGYKVLDLGVVRKFAKEEMKEITVGELRKLSYQPGGRFLLENCLVILDNPEVVQELLGDVEPEYNYTEKEVLYILQEASYDAFLDCLDFAPAGVIDLIKSKAVDIKLNDVRKRQAILDKTGFNVSKAIEIKEEALKDIESDSETTKRRVAPATQEKIAENENEKGGIRRTATPPTYKRVVTSK